MLIIVRHGRTESNASGLLLGRADPVLDELGRRQAGAAAERLAADPDLSVAAVYASPLQRAHATAAAIAERTGADLATDERWLELDYGDLDGVPVADVTAETWARWRSEPEFAPPGGESHQALRERVEAACDDLLQRAIDEDVVVVTHVSPIKAAVGWALGLGHEANWRTHVSVASISRVIGRGRPPSPALLSFNETGHLPEH